MSRVFILINKTGKRFHVEKPMDAGKAAVICTL